MKKISILFSERRFLETIIFFIVLFRNRGESRETLGRICNKDAVIIRLTMNHCEENYYRYSQPVAREITMQDVVKGSCNRRKTSLDAKKVKLKFSIHGTKEK